MMKLFAMLLLGTLAVPSSAHDFVGQDRKRLAWLGEMARLNAQKACAQKSDSNHLQCESGQIKWLAQTAASLPALLPVNTSPLEFAAMIENIAKSRYRNAWSNDSIEAESVVDCWVFVC